MLELTFFNYNFTPLNMQSHQQKLRCERTHRFNQFLSLNFSDLVIFFHSSLFFCLLLTFLLNMWVFSSYSVVPLENTRISMQMFFFDQRFFFFNHSPFPQSIWVAGDFLFVCFRPCLGFVFFLMINALP